MHCVNDFVRLRGSERVNDAFGQAAADIGFTEEGGVEPPQKEKFEK